MEVQSSIYKQLLIYSLFFIFRLLAHNSISIRHASTYRCNYLDQNIELYAEAYHIVQQTFSILHIIFESPCHFRAQ